MPRKNVLFNEGSQGTAIPTDSTTGVSSIRASGVAATAVSYDSAMAAEGSFGYNNTVTNNVAVLRVTSDTTANQQALSVVYKTPSVALDSGATVTFFTARHSGGVLLRWQLKSDGTLQIGDASNVFVVAVAAGTIKWNTFYRFELVITSGSTTAGVYQVRAYDASNNLLGTASSSTANLSANPITAFDLGNQGGLASSVTMGYDSLQIESGRTTEIGPYVSVTITVNAGVDQTGIEPYTTVNVAGTDNATGSPTRVWSQTAGSTVSVQQSGKTAYFTAPGTLGGTTVTLKYTVGTTADSVDITVLAVTERAVVNGAEVPMQIIGVAQEI